jgi:hypothetical protein
MPVVKLELEADAAGNVRILRAGPPPLAHAAPAVPVGASIGQQVRALLRRARKAVR